MGVYTFDPTSLGTQGGEPNDGSHNRESGEEAVRGKGGGLFFSQPILAHSNVSSGYGCFGLYTSTVIDLD